MRMPIIMSFILCTLLLSACGKKGPLYVPEDTKKSAYLSATQQENLSLVANQEQS